MEPYQQRYFPIVQRMEKLHAVRRLLSRRAMEACGMHHGQLPILEFVRENPGCTQAEIAQALFLTPSSIAQSTKRLQRDGYLQKKVSEQSQRSKQLSLTEKGRDASHACRQGFDDIDREIFLGTSEEELATLERCVEHLLQNAARLAGLDAGCLDQFSLIRLKNEGHQEGTPC